MSMRRVKIFYYFLRFAKGERRNKKVNLQKTKTTIARNIFRPACPAGKAPHPGSV